MTEEFKYKDVYQTSETLPVYRLTGSGDVPNFPLIEVPTNKKVRDIVWHKWAKHIKKCSCGTIDPAFPRYLQKRIVKYDWTKGKNTSYIYQDYSYEVHMCEECWRKAKEQGIELNS